MNPISSKFSHSECAEGCDIRPNKEPVHISLPMAEVFREYLRSGPTHERFGPVSDETSAPLPMPAKQNDHHPAATLA